MSSKSNNNSKKSSSSDKNVWGESSRISKYYDSADFLHHNKKYHECVDQYLSDVYNKFAKPQKTNNSRRK